MIFKGLINNIRLCWLGSGLLVIPLFSHAQSEKLSERIEKVTIKTERTTVHATMEQFYGDLLPTVQIAQWKQGYVVAYTGYNMESRYFFTDKNFRKTSAEYAVRGRVVFQVVVDNDEIAMLTGSVLEEEGDAFHNKIFLTKVNEAGQVLKETYILGSDDMNKPGASQLDNGGNPRLVWAGDFYIAFFPIMHNFKKPEEEKNDIHQGDCAYIITPQARVYSFLDWNISHSFEQRLLANKEYAILISKGDAGPRGLEADYYPLEGTKFEPIVKDEEDQNCPKLTGHLVYHEDKEVRCEAFKVSGTEGDNYLPFSIGDAVLMPNNELMVSYSYADGKPTHDIVWNKIHPDEKACATSLTFLTNTPEICEHSVHMAHIGDNRFLIFWKEFNIKGLSETLETLKTKYEEEEDEEEMIFVRHNVDVNKMAIIDRTGKFLVEPQEISRTDADWYYNIPLKDSHTPWNDIMDAYAHHARSNFIVTHEGNVLWSHHDHKSRLINLFVFK